MESFILFCVGASRERVKASDDNLPAHLVTTSTCRYLKWIEMGKKTSKATYSLLTNYLERTGSVSVSLIDCYYLGVGIIAMTKALSLLLAVT